MKKLVSILTLLICAVSTANAGYSLYVAPQLPEYVQVNGPYGPESLKNPELTVLHADHYCKPANYSRAAADEARRTEIIRSSSGTLTAGEVLAVCPTVLDAKYQRLWEAASAWERKNISGVGLSILSLGVAAGKPKALAVAEWSNQLWMGLYYPRKATINLDTEPDYDFSPAGDMPYSVPELSAEVWGQ